MTNETKWATDPFSPPGPRQLKTFNKAISRLRTAGRGERVIEGVHGKPETQYTMQSVMLFGAAFNPLSTEKEEEIGKAYNWTVSRKNARVIKLAVEAAILDVEASVPVTDNRISAEEHAREQEEQQKQQQEYAEKAEVERRATKASHAPIIAKKPSNALALIVAELHENQSDSQTDYFAHKITRYVAIGWRSTARESFTQLRRAAAGFKETEHLAASPDADKNVEHRENYSMGGGNYLKQGDRHSSGWSVCSYPLTDEGGIGAGLNQLEDGIPESPAASNPPRDSATIDISTLDPAANSSTEGSAEKLRSSSSCTNSAHNDGYTIREATNKRGPFWLVVQDHRVDRDEFEKLRDSAKAANGWYSRKWKQCPGGFGFSSLEDASTWATATFDTVLEPQL